MTITLAVFAKPPVVGDVKTRLASLVGTEGAARLAGTFLIDTVRMVRSLGWARTVLATAGDFGPEWDEPLVDLPRWPQGDGDLGDRMGRILTRALVEGASQAMLIGADLPGLPAAHLEAARIALRSQEATIGPAEDGGFYLIGLRRCPPGIFDGLPWSTDQALAQTLARLEALGLSVAQIPAFSDIDEPEDLIRLAARLNSGELRATATEALLRELMINS